MSELKQLEQVRAVLARLDPTQPMRGAATRSWYVTRPDGVGSVLAGHLQLEPASSHLVVGSVGCGKSSELLAAGRTLLATPGVFARYVEIAELLDLDSANEVSLIRALFADLLEKLSRDFPDAEDIQQLQHDFAFWQCSVRSGDQFRSQHDHDDSAFPFAPPPSRVREVPSELRDVASLLLELCEAVRRRCHGQLIWLLDGLDRLSVVTDFDRIVDPLVRTLKALGIGVAITGPRRAIASVERLGAAALFDEVHLTGPVDPTPESPGHAFLREVLAARAIAEVVPAAEQDDLIRWSGGVLRILLQIARESIKLSWVRNLHTVGPEQVCAAADKIGRALMLGLTDAELEVLASVQRTGAFAPRTDDDQALVLTNRVLEYTEPSGRPRHVVHPTIVRFLPDQTRGSVDLFGGFIPF